MRPGESRRPKPLHRARGYTGRAAAFATRAADFTIILHGRKSACARRNGHTTTHASGGFERRGLLPHAFWPGNGRLRAESVRRRNLRGKSEEPPRPPRFPETVGSRATAWVAAAGSNRGSKEKL